MIKYIDENPQDWLGKKVLLRVDFNVPAKGHNSGNNFRVRSHRDTVDFLLGAGAKVLLVSHITAADSFNLIVESLGLSLGQTLTMIPHEELSSLGNIFKACSVVLLDNIRQNDGEEQNDDQLAQNLAKRVDVFVNDAFSVSHRPHASVVNIIKYLPAYGGLLLKKEIKNLTGALAAPPVGKTLLLGGAKISTKLPVIKNFLNKADHILIGGALANDFFQAQGYEIGASVVDSTISPDIDTNTVFLPIDIIISDEKSGRSLTQVSGVKNLLPGESILDIGPETAKYFGDIIKKSTLVIWNGPMGLSEIDQFAKGTKDVAEAVSAAKNSIIGGGDTITAVDKFGLLDKYSFVSTGGGAMLEFLAGNELPGLKALGYYDK